MAEPQDEQPDDVPNIYLPTRAEQQAYEDAPYDRLEARAHEDDDRAARIARMQQVTQDAAQRAETQDTDTPRHGYRY